MYPIANYISFLAAFMGLFLSIHFFRCKKYPRASFLGVAILGVSFELIIWLFKQSSPTAYFLSFGNIFLHGPFFLFFITSLYRKIPTLHYFMLSIWGVDVIYKIYWLLQPFQEQQLYLSSPAFSLYTQIFKITGYAMAITICLISWQQLNSYTQQNMRYPVWVKQLVKILLCLHIIWIMNDILKAVYPPNVLSVNMSIISATYILITLCWIGLSTLKNTFVIERKAEVIHPKTTEAYKALETFMEKHKAYKKNDLTLKWLSQELGIRYKTLTQAIREQEYKNFYTYINHLRLQEFKRLLTLEESKKLSLEGLAKQAGFGSKTTFYAFFKQEEGTTPKKYQRQMLLQRRAA